VNPAAIGSLLRVFFWAWTVEWFVFITEVCLILWYFLSWKAPGHPAKAAHVRLGFILAGFSWITMAIIVSILGFMMDSGAWTGTGSLLSALFNPVYLPQLAFRTPLAMVSAGAFGLAIVAFLARGMDGSTRPLVSRALGVWTLAWTPPLVAGAIWYRSALPGYAVGNMQVAVATQAFQQWYQHLLWVTLGCAGLVVVVAACSAVLRARLPRVVMIAPALAVVALLGMFERVREFIRKPYAIHGYLYSNGYLAADYPLLKRDGILAHASFSPIRKVTKDNAVDAGEQVFLLACSRCHTMTGINSLIGNFGAMYGADKPWDREAIASYVATLHTTRSFMPPFPGTAEERGALADFILDQRRRPRAVEGAQDAGLRTSRTP
jgi:mono/diheme cytochrome c family protein